MKNFRKKQIYSILGVVTILSMHAQAGVDGKNLDIVKRYKWVLGGACIVLSATLIYLLKNTKTEEAIERRTEPINNRESIKGRLLNEDGSISTEEVDLIKHSDVRLFCIAQGKSYRPLVGIYVPANYQEKYEAALEIFERDQSDDAKKALHKIESTTYIKLSEFITKISNEFTIDNKNYFLRQINWSSRRFSVQNRKFDDNEFIQLYPGTPLWKNIITLFVM